MGLAPRYEIFRELPDKQPTCVETATSLDDAKDSLRQFAAMFPGDYFIFDTQSQQRLMTAQGARGVQARCEPLGHPEPAVHPATGERRKHARFAMCIALRLRGTKSDGTAFQETTSTEIVSTGGFGCSCIADLSRETLVDVFLVARENDERLLGRARVVASEISSFPWRKYSFALLNAHDDWFLVLDQGDPPEGAGLSPANATRKIH